MALNIIAQNPIYTSDNIGTTNIKIWDTHMPITLHNISNKDPKTVELELTYNITKKPP